MAVFTILQLFGWNDAIHICILSMYFLGFEQQDDLLFKYKNIKYITSRSYNVKCLIWPFGCFGGIQDIRAMLDVNNIDFNPAGGSGTGM